MKRKLQQRPKTLAFLCLWLGLAVLGVCHAQDASEKVRMEKLDLVLASGAPSDTQTLSFESPITEFSNSDPAIVQAERLAASNSQLTLTGLVLGKSTVRVRTGGRVILYTISVVPKPERLYVNIPESKRLNFPAPVEDVTSSVSGIVRIVQPEDNVVLLEALTGTGGKTTVTVLSGGQIYRYFVSTFLNRGADLLEIQNAFTAKGYRNLQISFDGDQATLSGSVPTQEELDDAVSMVKPYTPYVIVRASLGYTGSLSVQDPDEAEIADNIKRISGLRGITVIVRFPAPARSVTISDRGETGDTFEDSNTTIGSGGVSTTSSGRFTPPAEGDTSAPIPRPRTSVRRTTTTTTTRTIPEKIFLYGELQDDLEEARALRVARTFCPYVVSFMTVRDPIQLRMRLSFVEINMEKNLNVGIRWSNSNGGTGPNISLNSSANLLQNQGSVRNAFLRNVVYGLQYDWSATLNLLERNDLGKIVQSSTVFVSNGQPGFYRDGGLVPVINGFTVNANGLPIPTIVQVEIGLSVLIQPMGAERSAQIGPALGGDSTTFPNTLPSAGKYMSLSTTPGTGTGTVDESVKYVDENGLIGVNVRTSIAAPNGTVNVGGFATTQFTSRLVNTRAYLRDGESLVVTGLNDNTHTLTSNDVPFISRVPILGYLFRNPVKDFRDREVLLVVTPQIVRLKDGASALTPKPVLPEMQELLTTQGFLNVVPQIKPVRYDTKSVDLRPASIQSATESKKKKVKVPTESVKAAPVVVEPARETLPPKQEFQPVALPPPLPAPEMEPLPPALQQDEVPAPALEPASETQPETLAVPSPEPRPPLIAPRVETSQADPAPSSAPAVSLQDEVISIRDGFSEPWEQRPNSVEP